MANANPSGHNRDHTTYSTATRFIGRKAELTAIDRAARAKSTQVVYIVGEGGAGKTRLLREILESYGKRDRGFLVPTKVVDFYHVANHSIEGLMYAIYGVLRPNVVGFTDFEPAWQKLERHLAEPPASGGGQYPGLLKTAQDALIADLDRFAEDRRLVLVFDTAEKLVYKITEVEDALDLAQEQLTIWRWLCSSFLPRLRNALVIIAGRPEAETIVDDLTAASIQSIRLPLGDFEVLDALDYVSAKAETIRVLNRNLCIFSIVRGIGLRFQGGTASL